MRLASHTFVARYDLKVSVASDDSNLHDGVIVVSIGTRYSSYCANISRTYVINPTKKQVSRSTGRERVGGGGGLGV